MGKYGAALKSLLILAILALFSFYIFSSIMHIYDYKNANKKDWIYYTTLYSAYFFIVTGSFLIIIGLLPSITDFIPIPGIKSLIPSASKVMGMMKK